MPHTVPSKPFLSGEQNPEQMLVNMLSCHMALSLAADLTENLCYMQSALLGSCQSYGAPIKMVQFYSRTPEHCNAHI